ncbi:MAG TPA: phosphoribosylformylglycinamidine synthase subunit PurL [Acidimicrobiales bacterium]|nr:phosphoribosylformylglycinamidine synthase subunit PurL [Acidimicrobiales bacterium]
MPPAGPAPVSPVAEDGAPEAPLGPEVHRALGLTDDEAASVERILGRPPNGLELAMYAVMWSEHCSYKSSRAHLGRLPTQAPWVLVGPGENAGVVDVGDGLAVAVRIESHNHPSAIEPYQGAATGAGGILRDIFTMGARPVALLDSLHMGPLDDARSRWVLEGVVSGISGYGNSVGVPTVGGELGFHPCFAGNPLVNVMCVGVMAHDHLVLAQASGVGNLAVLLGSSTGRDGIGGVSVLASAAFDTGDEVKRPSVQVGDPFEEKRLIEACLALYDAGLVAGIQDLGGAGLTCATSETASRGGVGMDVDLSAVPLRMTGMTPPEIMTSESQERMLAIVAPDDLDAVLGVCRRWEVQATVVGTVTEGRRLRILDRPGGRVLADVPAASLHDDGPLYDRPLHQPADLEARRADDPSRLPAPADCGPALAVMLVDTTWVSSQYDHQLFLNTVEGPGGDAAVLRLKAPGIAGTGKALAVSTDSNSRWCGLDPRAGTSLVVAEAVLNQACVGARPLAVVNCLNFGNPEHAEVMWQLSEAIDGMTEACLALGVPVVGGNVSLYNASAGADIEPTPVVGLVGLVDRLDRRPPGVGLLEGAEILLLSPPGGDSAVDLAGSRWAFEAHGHTGGALPSLDVDAHLAVCLLVRELVANGLLAGVHDVADGGLGLAVAEMALRSGVGFRIGGVAGHAGLFAEGPSRVVACVAAGQAGGVSQRAHLAGVAVTTLGTAGGDRLVVDGLVDLGLAATVAGWRAKLPTAMGD